MAVKLVSPNAHSYNGLSTDDKPTAPEEGSTYYAVDTGEAWIYHDSMWVLKPETAALAPRVLAAL